MKKKLFLLSALLLTLGSCSTNDSNAETENNSEPVTLSEVTHSECGNHHSARLSNDEYNPFASKLILTYNEAEQIITGEYVNYMLSCDYTDAGINIEQDADGTLVLNPWNEADNMVDCICNINIYFIIRNASKHNYHLVVNRRTVTVIEDDGSKHQEVWIDYDGYISFEKQNVVTIWFNDFS